MTHRTFVIDGKATELVFCSSSVPADAHRTAAYAEILKAARSNSVTINLNGSVTANDRRPETRSEQIEEYEAAAAKLAGVQCRRFLIIAGQKVYL